MNNVTLENVKDFAFLANKAYASEAEIKNEQQSNKDIGNNYAVYNPATKFKDPVSGEYTIAFRGTQIGNEKISA